MLALQRNSADVSVAGGLLHVMPAGMFQPSSLSAGSRGFDFNLGRNVMTELQRGIPRPRTSAQFTLFSKDNRPRRPTAKTPPGNEDTRGVILAGGDVDAPILATALAGSTPTS